MPRSGRRSSTSAARRWPSSTTSSPGGPRPRAASAAPASALAAGDILVPGLRRHARRATRRLQAVDGRVGALARDQLGVRAALDDLAMVDVEDLVGRLGRGEVMGDEHGGAAAREALERLGDHALVLLVEAGR